jgi:hypothetical protein
MYLETDPHNAANARICDLQRAPRNANGKVDSWTDFFLLKPVESKKGNGQLLYDVNNRGNMLALWTFNDGGRTNDPRTEAEAGHGFLMRHGFSVLWCGWNGEVQADETQRLLCGPPIATDNGRTITGRAHLEITSTGKVFSRAELEVIAKLCQKWDVLAITDEIYEHILYDGATHVSPITLDGMRERTIVVNGMSKTYSVTGWRVGYIIAPPDISGAIRKMHDFMTVGAPAPLQEAGAIAMGLPDSYYEDLASHYHVRRDRLLAMLRNAGLAVYVPRGAY